MNFGDAQTSRRLPVYLLVDRSSSMAGEPIVAVNQGLQLLKSDLADEPRAVDSAWLSVISFGTDASLDVPLTELLAFTPPLLSASGSTALGAALRLLNRCIDNDITLSSNAAHTGDYKPLVFLFTDGVPTDQWQAPAQEVKQRTRAKAANIIAVACGSQAQTSVLKEITENVLMMENTNAGDFRALFTWVTQSVASSSKHLSDTNQGDQGLNIPPPQEQGFHIVM